MLAWLYRFAALVLSAGFSVTVFFIVFKLLPSRRIYWRTALFAALFCAVAFEAAKRLYAWYLTRFATLDNLVSNANIVAFVLFLVWIYYMAIVFLLGGELAETGDVLLAPVRDALRRRSLLSVPTPLEVVPAELGLRAELVGAVLLVLQQTDLTAATGTLSPVTGRSDAAAVERRTP